MGLWSDRHRAVCSGRASNTVSSEATSFETIVTAALPSLTEARKPHSNPRAAVGWYLEASDRALRAGSESPGKEASEARLIYNSACEEVTVLLWSNHELWNKGERSLSARVYTTLRFAAGSRRNGTWDSGYFDLFRTQQQVHEKIPHMRRELTIRAACWWELTGPPNPGNIFYRGRCRFPGDGRSRFQAIGNFRRKSASG